MALLQLADGFAMNFDTYEGLVPSDVVFLHGNLASNTWWEPALEVWKQNAKPEYCGRIFLGEWRGCGKSSSTVTGADLNPRVLARDYVKALRLLGVKKASLVGHSTGGLVALCALLEAPEFFERAVLLDPVSARGIQFEPAMYETFTKMSQDRNFCAAVMNGTIHNNKPDSVLFQRIVSDTFSVSKGVWHGIPDALKSINIENELNQIQHSVLLLHGEHDPVLPKEGTIAMALKLRNGRYFEIKDHGHSTNVEDPELFARLVDGFLFNTH